MDINELLTNWFYNDDDNNNDVNYNDAKTRANDGSIITLL